MSIPVTKFIMTEVRSVIWKITVSLSENSIEELIKTADVEGYFLALPNLPNNFMADIAKTFIRLGWRGVLVDALKRTSAMEQILALQADLRSRRHHLHDRLLAYPRTVNCGRLPSCPELCRDS
jgi:hypothetical protein